MNKNYIIIAIVTIVLTLFSSSVDEFLIALTLGVFMALTIRKIEKGGKHG